MTCYLYKPQHPLPPADSVTGTLRICALVTLLIGFLML
jgi:hypothetical protein